MALTPLSNDLNIIAALHDEPNVDDGLSAAQLKAKFDEGGKAIQTYINGTLKDFVDDLESGSGLADGAVTHPKLADDAVEENNIKDGEVTHDKLAEDAVNTANIVDWAVTSDKILPSAIKDEHLDFGAVTYYKLHDDSVDWQHIVDDAVASKHIRDGNITTAKIANKNVTKAKLDDSVQTSLGKADTAYQLPGTGIPKTDLASAVQTSLGKADTALQSAHEIPAGGTAHQLLVKHSNTDYDVAWEEPPQIPSTAADVGAIAAPASPNNYDVLTYYNSEWKAISPRDMDIVVTPSAQPSDGDVIYYDGNDSEWKADTPANAGIHSVPSGGTSGYVLSKASNTDYDLAWVAQSGGGGGTPYTSNPAALGTASPGSSDNYSRGDHVHPKPTASDIGAIAAPASPSEGNYLKYTSGAWAAATFPTIPSAATSTPANLGTAAVGSSTKYAKEDHVHNKPTYSASDVGAVAVSQGVAHAGEFVVVGSDGNITTVTMSAWAGGNY